LLSHRVLINDLIGVAAQSAAPRTPYLAIYPVSADRAVLSRARS